jgi:hypothetical protein
MRIYLESLLNLQQLDPFTVHVHSNGAAPVLLHIPANGQDRGLIRPGSPQQVQERAVPRDPDVGTDHGPRILRETLHGPGGVGKKCGDQDTYSPWYVQCVHAAIWYRIPSLP